MEDPLGERYVSENVITFGLLKKLTAIKVFPIEAHKIKFKKNEEHEQIQEV